MNILKELIDKCKCGVYLEVNPHRDFYMQLEDYIYQDLPDRIPKQERVEMIKRDTIVRLQFYPTTPVTCYVIYHWDVEEAVNEALSMFKDK